jgi:hypothetical protein
MPFFYVPGNHDVANSVLQDDWRARFGRKFYHFTYKGVLFLVLNTDDPPGSGGRSEAQVAWARGVLEETKDARWTIVACHRPLWVQADLEKTRWDQVEKALAGRKYTVFVGHLHRYVKYVRQGMNYYQLATTGGGSKLRGTRYGEFDHITWVTMKPAGPVLANVMLDGILPENLVVPETTEPVPQYNRKQPHPVRGVVYLDGSPAAGATVGFYSREVVGGKSLRFAGDGLVEGDGSFVASSSGPFDGLPAGEYAVTVAFDGRYGVGGDRRGLIPAAYGKAETTPLTAVVKAGKNDLTLEVKSAAGEREAAPAGKGPK